MAYGMREPESALWALTQPDVCSAGEVVAPRARRSVGSPVFDFLPPRPSIGLEINLAAGRALERREPGFSIVVDPEQPVIGAARSPVPAVDDSLDAKPILHCEIREAGMGGDGRGGQKNDAGGGVETERPYPIRVGDSHRALFAFVRRAARGEEEKRRRANERPDCRPGRRGACHGFMPESRRSVCNRFARTTRFVHARILASSRGPRQAVGEALRRRRDSAFRSGRAVSRGRPPGPARRRAGPSFRRRRPCSSPLRRGRRNSRTRRSPPRPRRRRFRRGGRSPPPP